MQELNTWHNKISEEALALGRALIADPDLTRRMQAGEATASRCEPCNRCIVEMERNGTRCVLRDGTSGSPSARLGAGRISR